MEQKINCTYVFSVSCPLLPTQHLCSKGYFCLEYSCHLVFSCLAHVTPVQASLPLEGLSCQPLQQHAPPALLRSFFTLQRSGSLLFIFAYKALGSMTDMWWALPKWLTDGSGLNASDAQVPATVLTVEEDSGGWGRCL
jgi:hypothetical protein